MKLYKLKRLFDNRIFKLYEEQAIAFLSTGKFQLLEEIEVKQK